MTPTAPTLTFLATIAVAVGDPIEVGTTRDGRRRIIPILGGTVTGPGLNGTVLPGGADFQVLRTEALTELRAEYAVETADGERLYVRNLGIRAGDPADIAALVRGEAVDPSRIYFRCTPQIDPTGERWAWLGSRMFVGTGERHPDEVRLHLFVID